MRVTCAVSKAYMRSGMPQFWYAFNPSQQTFLEAGEQSYAAFGCGASEKVVLIPYQEFEPCLAKMNQTTKGDRNYWHVFLHEIGTQFYMVLQQGEKVDVTKYVVSDVGPK